MTGPVFIKLGGKERRLRYDINAAVEMEELLGGKSLLYILTNPAAAGISAIRILLWGGLKHEERGLTPQRVGLMMQEYMESGGRLEELIARISEAIQKSKMLGDDTGGKMGENSEGNA